MNILHIWPYEMKYPKEIILTETQVDTLRSTIETLGIDKSLITIIIGLL